MIKSPKKESTNRTRRHIFINNDYYKEVAREALELEVDYGTVIDIALEKHFKKARGVNG